VTQPAGSQLFDHLRVIDDCAFRPAAMNMAIDDALFEQVTLPTLRFYRWDHPAISFGYFGKHADVAPFAKTHDLVRRWTGGGIVFHGNDLTYSIVIPAGAGSSAYSSRQMYAGVHRALRDALNDTGQRAELAATDSFGPSEACFEKPVKADVILGNRKVAGAAQRRTRHGLLQQGSVQNVHLADGLPSQWVERLAPCCERAGLDENVIARADEIAAAKYGTRAWLERR
jgi:lipoate-protein ligase A